MLGRIIKESAGFYYVLPQGEGDICLCRAKGIFRKKGLRPTVGDRVEFTPTGTQDVEGSVDEILPRKNVLGRPPVSNVDAVMTVFSGKTPEPNFLLLDRMLITLKRNEIEASVCFNKSDITDEPLINEWKAAYERAGYPVFVTSAKEGKGRDELLNFMKGRLTAFSGPSGVGKSSIMNMLTGSFLAKTGEVSRKTGHGKQTTRTSEIFVIEDVKDTYVIDTPGFGALDVSDIEAEKLSHYFPEMEEYEGQCRFLSCVHISEPGCAVKEAVAGKRIATFRYDDYKSIFNDIKSKRRY